MEVETINLNGQIVYQASWQGNKARSRDKSTAIQLLKSFLKLKEKVSYE